MTVEELAELVKRMRAFQDAYFKHRNQADLRKAKELERQVDAACNRLLDKRPRLFAEEVER